MPVGLSLGQGTRAQDRVGRVLVVDLVDQPGQGVDVAGRKRESGVAVRDPAEVAGGVAGDHRGAAGHGLQQGDRRAVDLGRRDVAGGPAEQRDEIALRHRPEKARACGDAEVAYLLPEVAGEGAVVADDQVRIREVLVQPGPPRNAREGLDDVADPVDRLVRAQRQHQVGVRGHSQVEGIDPRAVASEGREVDAPRQEGDALGSQSGTLGDRPVGVGVDDQAVQPGEPGEVGIRGCEVAEVVPPR